MELLDFPYTCPTIDNSINKFQDSIKENLTNLIEDIEEADRYTKKDLIDKCSTKIYKDFERYFEEVRKLNSLMREAANKQLNG